MLSKSKLSMINIKKIILDINYNFLSSGASQKI
jgi:hypothetical protein